MLELEVSRFVCGNKYSCSVASLLFAAVDTTKSKDCRTNQFHGLVTAYSEHPIFEHSPHSTKIHVTSEQNRGSFRGSAFATWSSCK